MVLYNTHLGSRCFAPQRFFRAVTPVGLVLFALLFFSSNAWSQAGGGVAGAGAGAGGGTAGAGGAATGGVAAGGVVSGAGGATGAVGATPATPATAATPAIPATGAAGAAIAPGPLGASVGPNGQLIPAANDGASTGSGLAKEGVKPFARPNHFGASGNNLPGQANGIGGTQGLPNVQPGSGGAAAGATNNPLTNPNSRFNAPGNNPFNARMPNQAGTAVQNGTANAATNNASRNVATGTNNTQSLPNRAGDNQAPARLNAVAQPGTIAPLGIRINTGNTAVTNAAAAATAAADGIAVQNIDAGGIAELAGMQPGDRIFSINGTLVDSGESLTSALQNAGNLGGLTSIGIRRNGQVQTMQVNLAGNAAGAGALSFGGLSFVNDQGGLRISQLDPGSWAQTAGMQLGDQISSLNGQAVSSSSQLIDRMRAAANLNGGAAQLTITRNGRQIPLTVNITPQAFTPAVPPQASAQQANTQTIIDPTQSALGPDGKPLSGISPVGQAVNGRYAPQQFDSGDFAPTSGVIGSGTGTTTSSANATSAAAPSTSGAAPQSNQTAATQGTRRFSNVAGAPTGPAGSTSPSGAGTGGYVPPAFAPGNTPPTGPVVNGTPVDTTTGVRSTVGANSATQGSTTNRAPGETAAAGNMPPGSTASGAAGTTTGTTAGTASGTTLGTSGTVSGGTAVGAPSTINSAAGGSTTNSPSAVNSSTGASGATLPSTTGTVDLLSDAFGTWSTSLRTATTDAEGAIRTQLGGLSDQVSAIRDGLVAAPNETAADARARTDRVRFQLNALRNRLQQIGPDATGTTRAQLEGLRTDLDSLYGRINELQP